MQVRLASDLSEIALDMSIDNGLLINGGESGLLSWLAPNKPFTERLAPGAYVADLIASADGATVNLFQAAPLAVTVVAGVTWP
jgi:hypothetical protein